jgi:hypothetical protein
MPFERGREKTGGRKAGVPNKLTGQFREAVQYVYDDIGGHQAFSQWANDNPTEFYKIASRLIPVEVHNHDTQIQVIVQRETPQPTQIPITPANALPGHSIQGAGDHA